MALPKLPTEVLDNVCQHVLPIDLVALSRSNSLLYLIAQRLLYRHLSISVPRHNVGLVIALAKRPELARHVRTLDVRLSTDLLVFKSFYRHLATALANMPELITLYLFVDPSVSWILHALALPRLLHFGCSFSLDSHVAEFLGKAQALLELELDAVSNPPCLPLPPFPATSIPKLSQFMGSPHTARAVVPGRPVQSICLSSGDMTEDDLTTIARSTATVAMFVATTGLLPVPLLGLISQYMPYLVYLRIMTTYAFLEAPGLALYKSIEKALAALHELDASEVLGMHWSSSQKGLKNKESVWQPAPLVDDIDTADNALIDGDHDHYSDILIAY